MTKQEFVEQAHAAAMQSSRRSGMPPMVTVSQAALESNWGQSKLSREANNFFGIKAHAGHDRIEMLTNECEHGSEIVIRAEFAKYPSMLDCFQCRDGIIARGAVYADARGKLGDETAFIAEIAKHWATDPKYAEKLRVVLNEVKGMLK
jgi:flagellum-specific peptidoglycan hydrolase FlgJ